jgi:hypothetical protein
MRTTQKRPGGARCSGKTRTPWQCRVIQERMEFSKKLLSLLNYLSMSNFGLFVRLIELHEHRRSTRTD